MLNYVLHLYIRRGKLRPEFLRTNILKVKHIMPALLTTLVGFIPAIAGKVYDYFSNKATRRADLAALEHERKMAVEQRLKELALDKSKSDSLWALEQLRHSDRYMRWAIFIIIWAPIVGGAFFPLEIKSYFDNVVSSVPEYWVGMAVGITTAVFGIREIMRFKSK